MKVKPLLFAAYCCGLAAFSNSAQAAEINPSNYDEDLREMLEVLRSDVNGHKVEVINAALKLSEKEAVIFWPIYKAYEAELAELSEDKLDLIGDYYQLYYNDATHDESWDDIADRSIRGRQNRLALWQEYHGKLSAALSPYRAAQFLQFEGQIALLVDLSIASELPHIGVAKSQSLQPVPTRTERVSLALHATVDSIDYDSREVVLRGDHGRLTTLTVSDEVKRLEDVDAGDQVHVEYEISVVAELREPTAQEIEKPLVVLDAAGKADENSAPAIGMGRSIRAVCTIEGLDRQSEMVSLKGPAGRYFSVKSSNPERLSQLSIGDTVVITYTEAVAMSIEKL